ncbi:MAG: ABC transporter ATP-binding protein [Planctomycetota bacterium]
MAPASDAAISTAAVSARDLRFTHPGARTPTIDLDEFTVETGQHTAIVGPSGCGKTTLLRLVTGALKPESGEIEVLGRNTTRMTEAARRTMRLTEIGMVFQSFALLDYLSVTENILLPYRLGARTENEAPAGRVPAIAQSLGIDHLLERKPIRLSQGERQRVAIARALVTCPKLIACDEPTGNLDPARARGTIDLIMSEADRIGATVLLVTHDHGLLDRCAQTLSLGGDA